MTGTVVDADSLRPIAGPTVSVNGRHVSMSDANGNYAVTPPRDDTRYTYVKADGYDWDFRALTPWLDAVLKANSRSPSRAQGQRQGPGVIGFQPIRLA